MTAAPRVGRSSAPAQPPRRALIKAAAIPAEHGGWGFLLEPLALGLLVAWSWQGLWLSVAAVGVFLVHQPLKIALRDHRKGRRSARAPYGVSDSLCSTA